MKIAYAVLRIWALMSAFVWLLGFRFGIRIVHTDRIPDSNHEIGKILHFLTLILISYLLKLADRSTQDAQEDLCDKKAGGLQLYNLIVLFKPFNFSFPASLIFVPLSLG